MTVLLAYLINAIMQFNFYYLNECTKHMYIMSIIFKYHHHHLHHMLYIKLQIKFNALFVR